MVQADRSDPYPSSHSYIYLSRHNHPLARLPSRVPHPADESRLKLIVIRVPLTRAGALRPDPSRDCTGGGGAGPQQMSGFGSNKRGKKEKKKKNGLRHAATTSRPEIAYCIHTVSTWDVV